MHHVFNKIADPGDERRQDDKIEFRINMINFECSGYQETQKYAVPDGMKIIEVEMFIINPDLARRNPT
jgi:hypothetical protein